MRERAPQSLDYAEPERRGRRWRRALFLTCVAAAACFSWGYGHTVSTRCQLMYWQARCLNYAAPPDQIVYEEWRSPRGDESAVAVPATNAADGMIGTSDGWRRGRYRQRPSCWGRFEQLNDAKNHNL